MTKKYSKQQQPAAGRYATGCVSALMGLVTSIFDLETGMLVASTVGNLHSKFGQARPLGIWSYSLCT